MYSCNSDHHEKKKIFQSLFRCLSVCDGEVPVSSQLYHDGGGLAARHPACRVQIQGLPATSHQVLFFFFWADGMVYFPARFTCRALPTSFGRTFGGRCIRSLLSTVFFLLDLFLDVCLFVATTITMGISVLPAKRDEPGLALTILHSMMINMEIWNEHQFIYSRSIFNLNERYVFLISFYLHGFFSDGEKLDVVIGKDTLHPIKFLEDNKCLLPVAPATTNRKVTFKVELFLIKDFFQKEERSRIYHDLRVCFPPSMVFLITRYSFCISPGLRAT